MLQLAVDWLVYGFLNLSPDSRSSQFLHFFIYDSAKILLLLLVMIAVIGCLRSYIPRGRVKEWLSRSRGWGFFFAALFGAVTPFCSCSSIPIFLGFLEAGVPLGTAFSFLITSPVINEYLVVLMAGYFGIPITLLYVTSGILIGTFSGMILSRWHLDRFLVNDMVRAQSGDVPEIKFDGHWSHVKYGLFEALNIVKKIWLWVLFGVGIGALIHNYVPEAWIQSAMAKTGFFSVPIAVAIGVPLYGSCAAIVPIAVVLFQKGIPLGTALAFMMAMAALSLPEAIILRRAMKLPLIAIFFGTVALAITLTGYLFNFIYGF